MSKSKQNVKHGSLNDTAHSATGNSALPPHGPEGHGKGGAPAPHSDLGKGMPPLAFAPNDFNHNFNFTFSTDLSTVQSMSIADSIKATTLDISTSTFTTTVGLNDQSIQAVLSVSQTSSDNHFATTRIYGDTDGDGKYVENFDIQVAKTTDASLPLHQQTFTFNTDGTITAGMPVNNDPHHPVMDQNAVLSKVTLNNVTYVTQTEATPNSTGYHFEVFRDDNADGTWTEIAHGETSGTNIDSTTATINLVGIQSYLADASAIIG